MKLNEKRMVLLKLVKEHIHLVKSKGGTTRDKSFRKEKTKDNKKPPKGITKSLKITIYLIVSDTILSIYKEESNKQETENHVKKRERE